jgi:hypothetical protein
LPTRTTVCEGRSRAALSAISCGEIGLALGLGWVRVRVRVRVRVKASVRVRVRVRVRVSLERDLLLGGAQLVELPG